jgi:hypothetical protein
MHYAATTMGACLVTSAQKKDTGSDGADTANSSRRQRASLGSVLLALLAAATAAAQTSGGAIVGTVTDPSGAVVAAAEIMIEEVSTGENWRLSSSIAGLYHAPNLPVGSYKLIVSAVGFSNEERNKLKVEVGSEHVQLALGRPEQTVTVALQGATVDSATSQTGALNSGQVVRELPLNGRDWTTLAALQPGVSVVRTEDPPVLDVPRGNRGLGVMMAIGGSRPQQSSYWLDGVNVNDYAGEARAEFSDSAWASMPSKSFPSLPATPRRIMARHQEE